MSYIVTKIFKVTHSKTFQNFSEQLFLCNRERFDRKDAVWRCVLVHASQHGQHLALPIG